VSPNTRSPRNCNTGVITVGRGIAAPTAAPKRCVKISLHTAPQQPGSYHEYPAEQGLINKRWELGSFCSAFIHRSQCRVHNLCTLTCFFIFQTTVLASAYPRHYSRPWLLEESLPPFACGWLPTQLPESAGQVTSFQLTV
jgi:hypothetical protein